MIRSKAVKDTKKKVLRSAEDLVAEKAETAIVEDLTRTGVVWSGMLELEDPIAASEVAALLSAHELIRATRLVDSEDSWTAAAAYAALGAFSEPAGAEAEKIEVTEPKEPTQPIGFVASAKSHS